MKRALVGAASAYYNRLAKQLAASGDTIVFFRIQKVWPVWLNGRGLGFECRPVRFQVSCERTHVSPSNIIWYRGLRLGR